jgi:hypothetical protein
MIDALIGAVIAVLATSSLVLLAEVVTNMETGRRGPLTEYEESVFDVVKEAHPDSRVSKDLLLSWMEAQASEGK